MEQVKISIITAVLNAENTIEKTIRSVVEQTYPNVEYIIIDGKSSDRTMEIIRKYSDRISKWVSEKDNGIYDAMNKGIGMATGDVIALLNSDDWYEADALEYVAAQFQDKGLDMLFANIRITDGRQVWDAQPVSTERLRQRYKMMPVYHPATFVRRRLFLECGIFDIQYRIAADYEWVLRVLKTKPSIKCSDKVTTFFSITGISSVYQKETYEETKRIALDYVLRGQDEEATAVHYKKQDMVWQYKDMVNKPVTSSIFKRLSGIFPKRKIYIFGTGYIGEECYKLLCTIGLSNAGFVDNNSELWGQRYGNSGLFIFEPKILDYKNDFVIIASTKYEEEIKCQLESMGFGGDDNIMPYSRIRELAIKEIEKLNYEV
jgi:glycosyltransferase involved in cell wall biosynthesis